MPPERSHLLPHLLSFDLPPNNINSQVPFPVPIAFPNPFPLPIPPDHPHPQNQKPKRFVSRPLQRNQACSTCRSRKVRCDASKPACGACRRSAAAHGENPDIVSCHYDSDLPHHLSINNDQQLAQLPTDSNKKTNSKVAILEQKIADLESLIAQLDIHSHSTHDSHSFCPNPDPLPSLDCAPSASIAAFSNSTQPSLAPRPATDRPPDALLWPNWPSTLPPRPVLTHLVRLYLAHNTGAGQTIFLDHPALQAALHLPPNHPHFPPLALLHAILALAYRHHAAPDELARNLVQASGAPVYWPPGQPVDQFHYLAAKRAIENALLTATQLFKTTQALVLVCHYAYRASRLVEVWVLSGLAIRFATPLGLNRLETCAGHLDGSKPRPRVLLPAPHTVAEKYERAATFWSAFQMDRFLSVSSGRAHAIDEADISSLLPACPGTSMASLGPVDPARNALALSHPHFFSVHPPDVDARQLELKATVLLGRIAAWLRRAPNPVGFNLEKVWRVPSEPIPDLRGQPEFVKLDQDLISLQLSLPRFITQSIFASTSSNSETQQKIDHSKIMVNLIVNLSEMILHECFMSKESEGGKKKNSSFRRVVDAALKSKAIGDKILSSGFEFRYLNRFIIFCWMVACRQLMRDLVSTELSLLSSLSTSYPSSTTVSTTTTTTNQSTIQLPLEEVSSSENNSRRKQKEEYEKELQDYVNQRVFDVNGLVGIIGCVEKSMDSCVDGSGGEVSGNLACSGGEVGGGGVGCSGREVGSSGGGGGLSGKISEEIIESFEDRFKVYKVCENLV